MLYGYSLSVATFKQSIFEEIYINLHPRKFKMEQNKVYKIDLNIIYFIFINNDNKNYVEF
jgi:hypothetical protein